jgi:zinc protease
MQMKTLNKMFASVTLAFGTVLLAPGVHAAPVKVTTVEGVTEYRLDNGLRVLLFPDASQPTLTTNVVYLVGSRNETYGETGMAHLLEHMMFKKSAKFGAKAGSKDPVTVLKGVGGNYMGTTYLDRTNYYATFPANADNLRQVLELEADRMVNSVIDRDELWNPDTKKGEMTVVRNEYESGESNPVQVLRQRINAAAFSWHNYGKSTIGARSDIEQVDAARLRAFYETYYQPDNAVLMVAGRFDEAAVLGQVQALFGPIAKPKRVLKPTITVEPVQDGERMVTVRRNGGVQLLSASYHEAPASHDDSVALALLDHILTAPPGGRLHKALVESKLATQVVALNTPLRDSGLGSFFAVLPKEADPDAVQQVMLKVIENLKNEPVTADEVQRAKQAWLVGFNNSLSNTAGATIALTESVAAGDWRLMFKRRDLYEQVDAATVQAAAVKYLKASNRTVGRFIPTSAPDRTEVPGVPDIAAALQGYKGRTIAQGEVFDPSPANVAARTEQVALPNGMKASLLPKASKGGAVNVSLQLRLGSAASLNGKAEIGSLTASMLMRGGARLSRQQIADAFNAINTQVSVGGTAELVDVSLKSSREHLPAAMALLAEVLQKPAFNKEQLQEMQRSITSGIENQIPEPQAQAMNAMMRALDPTDLGHVQHVLTLPEQLKQYQAVTLEQVSAFYSQFYGASSANFAAVGDFDAPQLKQQLASLFGNWKPAQAYERIPGAIKAVKAQHQTLATPDKANSFTAVYMPMTISEDTPAYPALALANYMIGGGLLGNRLSDRIRQKEGLSYAINSALMAPAHEEAAMWLAVAISAPQNAAKVQALMREELNRVLTEGFTEAELKLAKQAWKQGVDVDRSKDAGLAKHLVEQLGKTRKLADDVSEEAAYSALTLAQVNAALRAHLKTDQLSVISAGDFSKVATQVASK